MEDKRGLPSQSRESSTSSKTRRNFGSWETAIPLPVKMKPEDVKAKDFDVAEYYCIAVKNC